MKATRKLIPAIAMLLISAVMMSTATFAWFSTNETVTANGFNVTVKADNTFLVISETQNDVNGKETVVNINSGVTGILIPARPMKDSGVNTSFAGQATNAWQTGTSGKADDALDSVRYSEDLQLDETQDSLYFIHKTLYIRSAKGFPAARDLILQAIHIDGNAAGSEGNDVDSLFADAISVVIKCGNKYYNYVDGEAVLDESYILDDEVTDSADTVVDVYIYINGDNEYVKTSNATTANLIGMSVSLTFSSGIPEDAPEGT